MEEQEYVDAYNDGYEDCYVKLKETEAERDDLRKRVEALEWLRVVERLAVDVRYGSEWEDEGRLTRYLRWVHAMPELNGQLAHARKEAGV